MYIMSVFIIDNIYMVKYEQVSGFASRNDLHSFTKCNFKTNTHIIPPVQITHIHKQEYINTYKRQVGLCQNVHVYTQFLFT